MGRIGCPDGLSSFHMHAVDLVWEQWARRPRSRRHACTSSNAIHVRYVKPVGITSSNLLRRSIEFPGQRDYLFGSKCRRRGLGLVLFSD